MLKGTEKITFGWIQLTVILLQCYVGSYTIKHWVYKDVYNINVMLFLMEYKKYLG